MRKVVILLSDKRSGSTMFQRELCKHPDISTVDYSPHTYEETHHWLKAAVILNKAPETFMDGKVYRGYGSRKNAKTYLLDCIKSNDPDFKVPKDNRELVFNGWEALCERFAHPVFFEKSPQYPAQWSALSLMLEWIERTSFEVKIIAMTRNPLSVLYSAYELFHTNPEKRQYTWLNTQKNLLAFKELLPKECYYHVKYENIIKDPVEAFGKICDFIGLERCNEVGAKVHDQSLTKWADDRFFRLQLDDTVKQIAISFGYTDSELSNPIKPKIPMLDQMIRKTEGKLILAFSRLHHRFVKPIIIRLKKF